MIAEKWDISREDMERFAFESHNRAVTAIDEGRFNLQIAPVGDVAVDEGPRRGGSLEKMATLPVLVEGGRLTAACASQISDAAVSMLLASEDAVKSPWPQAAGSHSSHVCARC